MKGVNWMLTDMIVGGKKKNTSKMIHQWAKRNRAYIKKEGRKRYGY